jgi:hypothetical protein
MAMYARPSAGKQFSEDCYAEQAIGALQAYFASTCDSIVGRMNRANFIVHNSELNKLRSLFQDKGFSETCLSKAKTRSGVHLVEVRLLRNDDRVVRLQHDILLHVLAFNYGFVVECKAYLLTRIMPQNVDLLLLGIIGESTRLGDCL